MALSYFLLMQHPFASQSIPEAYYRTPNYIKKLGLKRFVSRMYPPNSDYLLHSPP